MIRIFTCNEGKLMGRGHDTGTLRRALDERGALVWVDIEAPTDEEIKSILDGVFHFHPLAIEDCATPSSLPKVEDYDDYLFIVAHCADPAHGKKFTPTEFNLFIGRDYLVTFHHARLDVARTVAERYARVTDAGAIRSADRLAHFLLDTLVDRFKPVTDRLGAQLDQIEEDVLSDESTPSGASQLIPRLIEVRSEINQLRQIIRPLRDVAGRLAVTGGKNIRVINQPYFRDLRDNLVRVDETAAGHADHLLISFDLYLSKSDFQANEGIKVLTAITAITLPAILVGTWYGMNFENMPELKTPLGYPIALGVTVLLTAAMWFWCKRRRWI